MINNPQHVKEVRDLVHAAVDAWGSARGLNPGELNARDYVTALAMVIRDVVQGAPDGNVRQKLIAEITMALAEPGQRSLIMPGHPGWKH